MRDAAGNRIHFYDDDSVSRSPCGAFSVAAQAKPGVGAKAGNRAVRCVLSTFATSPPASSTRIMSAPSSPASTAPPIGDRAHSRATADVDRVSRYVPRILHDHFAHDPQGRWWIGEGTAAFVDISGFTKLSERLARKGKEGAEQLTEAIGKSFEAVMQAAYDNGGSLLKFGGDALLIWFDGVDHAARACRAAIHMRRVLRAGGCIEVPGAKGTLRMSQGVHSGHFHFFAVGTSHRDLLPTGPAWSTLVGLEHTATAGEILISPETAARLPRGCRGELKGPGVLLRREPPGHAAKLALRPRPPLPLETLAHCLSPAVRAHVVAGGGTSEHRLVSVAFVHFDGVDALVEKNGPAATADALHRLLTVVDAAVEKQGVAFLASDLDADGGKLILTAGAPSSTGDDEERMLLALRAIVEADLPIPVRIGVNRGSVFAGDIGPAYRRTCTVMGDAVNLAARLMAKAEPGTIYATADVLDRSNTLFATTELEPFTVKGKARPVQAWSVGRAQGSRTRQVALEQLPLTGRDAELALLHDALAAARTGSGRLVEIVGEAGVGKTRLLEAMRGPATDFRNVRAACEAYTASTPYAVWRELLRELMGFGRDDPDHAVLERVRDEVATRVPELAPWLPLIGIAFDVTFPPTPEVDLLAERNRRAKLHEAVGRFLEVMLLDPTLIEIENAHQMDEASAELLAHVTGQVQARPWLFAVTRRPTDAGFVAAASPPVLQITLESLAETDALRMVELASEKHPLHRHVVEVVARRSGGNPQFLRDLLRSAIESGGVGALPDSAAAATMARIDALGPEDRRVVRQAAVFGLTFHPRMLAWFADEGVGELPSPATWERLRELFEEEPDGYLRFRRSLLREAAYDGLPFKLRRRLHGIVAARMAAELDHPEDAAGILSLHCIVAGDNLAAWGYAVVAGRHAAAVYAYVEAARFYERALEAGRHLKDLGTRELAGVHRAIGEAWYLTSEFKKAADAYVAARRLVAADPLADSDLMLKLSYVETKLGNCDRALRWIRRARKGIAVQEGAEAVRQTARSGAWYAQVLQLDGRTRDALHWAERAVTEAEAAADQKALGDALFVIAWAYNELGNDQALPMMQRSLEAFERAGNLVEQAAVLNNLGVVCQAVGRWDEAVDYYERARDADVKIGSTLGAPLAKMNIAEILADRGAWAEAEAMLRETLPFWRASRYQYFLALCQSYLGRVLVRSGRAEEGLRQLNEAKKNFLEAGADQETPAVDAYVAEALVALGDPGASLLLVDGMLADVGASHSVARVAPQLERARGHALLRRGDLAGARIALGASLAAARSGKRSFEAALTLLSLIELDRREGGEPSPEIVAESCALLDGLRVRAVAPVPLPAA